MVKTMMMIMISIDWRKVLNPISNQDHYQRFSSSQTSDTPWAEIEPAQNQFRLLYMKLRNNH